MTRGYPGPSRQPNQGHEERISCFSFLLSLLVSSDYWLLLTSRPIYWYFALSVMAAAAAAAAATTHGQKVLHVAGFESCTFRVFSCEDGGRRRQREPLIVPEGGPNMRSLLLRGILITSEFVLCCLALFSLLVASRLTSLPLGLLPFPNPGRAPSRIVFAVAAFCLFPSK
jgi:hypothetical protein